MPNHTVESKKKKKPAAKRATEKILLWVERVGFWDPQSSTILNVHHCKTTEQKKKDRVGKNTPSFSKNKLVYT